MRTNDESIKLLETSKPIKRQEDGDRQIDRHTHRQRDGPTDREACIQRDGPFDD